MDTLTFVAEMTKGLAWPLVVFFLLFVLKTPLKDLVPLIRKLKYGDFEAEFGQRLAEIEQLEAEMIQESNHFKEQVKERAAAKEHPLFSRGPAPTEERPIAFQLAYVNPRSAILEAWLNVEVAAKRAAQRLDLVQKEPVSSIHAIRALDLAKVLDAAQVAIFHDLRALRNEAAHTPEMALSTDMALRYVDVAESLARTLSAIDKSN